MYALSPADTTCIRLGEALGPHAMTVSTSTGYNVWVFSILHNTDRGHWGATDRLVGQAER